MASQTTAVPTQGHPQLIVTFKPEAKVTRTPQGLVSPAVDVSSLQSIIDRHGASVHLLFGPTEDQIHNDAPLVDGHPDLARFHHVHAPPENLEQLASELLAHEHVDAAYLKPVGSPPIAHSLIATTAKPPTVTPNYTNQQIYLNPAPVGIDAVYAQTLPGGYGDGVKVADCEWGWVFTHEDLAANKNVVSKLIAGVNDLEQSLFFDHGTAVAGIISGALNDYGVTGIAPRATFSASSFKGPAETKSTIFEAAKKLGPGDILLLEIQRSGPNPPAPPPNSNVDWGNMPVEWWPDDLEAIQSAVTKGIIVVEAAGNGYQNLDDNIYDSYPPFGSTWKNPLNPINKSSGAILVGAGNPPPGTHGISADPYTSKPFVDRSRCKFSNYGSRVDCQGWGQQVTSTGYGDLQGGDNNKKYTDNFSGTSSASPIVVGALAAVQGILKKAKKPLLTPSRALSLLRSTGSPQQDSPDAPKSQRIGNRPDLRMLLIAAGAVSNP